MGNLIGIKTAVAGDVQLNDPTSSPSRACGGRKRSRKASSDEEYEDQSKVLDELLTTPKRKKLKSTSIYIYETLFENGENSDVTISALGKEWKLHKVYLCQSGYFSSMFKGSWKESNLEHIEMMIPDENIDIDALDTALGSLYTDDVMIAPTTVVPVLAAATLLSLDELILQCAHLMIETMSVKSVCCYHIASIMYGQTQVTAACIDWLEKNIMHAQSLTLLQEISSSLMKEIIASHTLYVMQVEMDVYTMLRKWLFLKLVQDWQGTYKELTKESDEYFKKKFKQSKCHYLDSDEGREYAPPFSQLRLQHIINDVSSIRIIEDDGIVPSSWLAPIFRQRWIQMLRVDQMLHLGLAKMDFSEFRAKSMRCGRILDKDGQYCWRWTGYNYGVDLLVSFNARLIIFKRNTLTQQCTGAVSLQDEREITFELNIASLNDHGRVKYAKTSGMKSISLSKDEERVIMSIDRYAEFPLHISCQFLTYVSLVRENPQKT